MEEIFAGILVSPAEQLQSAVLHRTCMRGRKQPSNGKVDNPGAMDRCKPPVIGAFTCSAGGDCPFFGLRADVSN
jgi:hypothetical protein